MGERNRRGVLRVIGLTATLSVAGCSSDEANGNGGNGAETTAEAFGISNVVFAADEPGGYQDYEKQPDASYRTDEVVWLYFEVDNAASESSGAGEKRFDFDEQLVVTDADGETIFDEAFSFGQELPEDRDLNTLFVVNDLTLPANPSIGDYTADIELTDGIDGDTATTTATFTVTES
jgi:hypothetical protein